MNLPRRGFVTGVAALFLVPVTARAEGFSPEVTETVARVLAGRVPLDGGITIDAPTMAENGAQVAVTLRVDSPMTAQDHVTAIHLIATQNPAPELGTFRMTPHLARAEVFTRIRLAQDQEFLVLAEHSDGRVFRAAARVAVALGGCVT